jgi:AraC-like DNA-binding protein
MNSESTAKSQLTPSIEVWRGEDLPGVELFGGTSVTRTVPPHWHSEFQFCVITGGGGDLLYKGVRHHTNAGSMFAIHPGEVHANETEFEEGCTYRTFNIDPGVIDDLDPLGRGLAFSLKPVIEDADVIDAFLACSAGVENGISRLAIDSLLLESVTRLVDRYGWRPSRSRLSSSSASMQVVRDYLIDHYSQNVSLKMLAEIAGLSPFHLVRSFRDRVGLPPHKFQICVRLERSKDLLRKRWSIANVAAECGFADQSHYIRSFKRVVGVTPTIYRDSL